MNQGQIRWILNTIFLIGAALSILIYFVWPEEKTLFLCFILTSMAIKVVEFFIRFMF